MTDELIDRKAALDALAMAAWKHDGDDAYSAGMEDGARHQSNADHDAILALPAADTSALGAAVKPLVWEHHPMGLIAAPPTGRAYIIDIRVKNRVFFIKGMEPPPKVDTLDQAKSIAQADYTSRILAAIQPPTHAAQLAAALALPEVAAMVGSAKDVMDWRYGPTIRPDSTCFERMRSALAALEARHDHN